MPLISLDPMVITHYEVPLHFEERKTFLIILETIRLKRDLYSLGAVSTTYVFTLHFIAKRISMNVGLDWVPIILAYKNNNNIKPRN